MLVATFLLYGGLYHVIRLWRLRFFFVAWGELLFGSYFITSVYPASFRAFSYSSFASKNSCLELEMVVNLFCMELGMFFSIDGG